MCLNSPAAGSLRALAGITFFLLPAITSHRLDCLKAPPLRTLQLAAPLANITCKPNEHTLHEKDATLHHQPNGLV
ncbi:hypothetical protein CCH79_00009656 [Gambusia affinis]|uniref:Uncharacterized protein n=1 Tax=Gambusia affinis TaxID=33528 RepID=A0A315W320_GAMAF|nr:hypothetical protein CCH79_00009656 [Gambusia affinis]